MKELLQKIYELTLGPVIELLRKLWEMPAEDFLGLLWAVVGPLLKFVGIAIAASICFYGIFLMIKLISEAIAVYQERKNRS